MRGGGGGGGGFESFYGETNMGQIYLACTNEI